VNAIRRGLRRGALAEDEVAMLRARLAEHPRNVIPARSRIARGEQIRLFIANAEKEFATVARVSDAGGVPGAVADYLATQNLPTDVVIAPDAELLALPWAERPLLRTRPGRAEATDTVGIQRAYAGVVETGTLIVLSDPATPTTINLLPDSEIVVLRASRIVGAYEDVWDRMRSEFRGREPTGFMPRTVMMITGPSRSADVEQTLELGAHGPRRLHVVLIDDDPATHTAA
jgi:L-lactate dehydrogenase complex protein LldG